MNENIEKLKRIFAQSKAEIAKVIIGQEEVVAQSLVAIFTGNHALIEAGRGVVVNGGSVDLVDPLR